MTTIVDIYKAAERLINEIIRKEMVAQGHHLTGEMEESLFSQTSRKRRIDMMEGFAVDYTKFVEEGFPASSANYGQVPFLIDYFKKRGLEEKEATAASFATVRVWMKEGMPTQASKRFSSTGSRTSMIENAFTGSEAKIDEFIGNGIDFVVEEKYRKEKSEKI